MADHPLKPAMDRRLGRPLPHQLPNPTRADPSPINLSPEGRMRYYSPFPVAIPQKRVRSHALLTRPPLSPKGSLDLHVLGLPPAFVLSQDQTLKLNSACTLIPDVRTSAHLQCATVSIKPSVINTQHVPDTQISRPARQDTH